MYLKNFVFETSFFWPFRLMFFKEILSRELISLCSNILSTVSIPVLAILGIIPLMCSFTIEAICCLALSGDEIIILSEIKSLKNFKTLEIK